MRKINKNNKEMPNLEGGPIEHFYTATFAKRLHDLRLERGLSKSDLAKKIWGTMTDGRGYEVARNRDRISVWESGRAMPTSDNLEQLATALGVPVSELAPDLVSAGMASERRPAISMTMVEGRPDTVRLVVNTLTSLATAAEVIRLLSGDPRTAAAIG